MPPATGKSTSEKAGTQEPSSKAASVKDADVLTNGALTAAGSPADVDGTCEVLGPVARQMTNSPSPATGSRHLTGGQRSEIMQGIGSQRDGTWAAQANNDANAVVGAELPQRLPCRGLPQCRMP